MFNSGIRGKRATDGLGFVSSQEKFIQKTFPIPKINSFSVANSDDLALDPAGGQTVEINGLNFESGATIIVGGESISVVTFVNSTKLTFTSPAKASGSYTVFVTNPNGGTAILVPGLVYSGLPTFTTSAGSLGTYTEVTTIDEVIEATEGADPITYSLVSGSLPAGATLNSAGYITGTAPVDNSSNTYTFTIRATDSELQDSTRQFSLTINTDVVTWSTPSAGTINLVGDQAMSNVTLLATAASGYNVSYTANTLPNNVFLTGNTVYGTPNTDQTVVTTFTATAANTNRTATRTVTWVVTLSDQFFKQTVLAINADSGNTWITDSSTNGLGITPAGDTRPSAFSPYNTVWSNYFDGSGDYLSPPSNVAFQLGTGDFTIQFWVYLPSASTTQVFCDFRDLGNQTGIVIYSDSGTLKVNFNNSGGVLITGGSLTSNAWTLISLTRESGSSKLYINGVQSGSTASDTNNYSNQEIVIGSSFTPAQYTTGYISNFQVVKGSALTISLPTTPFTNVSGTSLLTCQSNRFVDNSTNAFAITRNGDVTVSSFGPFTETDTVTGSGYFDGTGDYLSVTSNAAFGYGTGDFTIEFWLYLNSTALQTIFSNLTSDTSTNPHIYINTSIRYYTAGADRITGASLVVGQWYHIALVRASGSTRLYINGTQSGSTYSDSNNYGTTAPLGIGTYWKDGSLVTTNTANGYFSNIRVVKGTAVYTSNFTPPTSLLTAISNTSLLTLQNRLGHNNNTFLDTSGNKFNITRNGNTTQGTFSPFSLAAGEWSNYFDGSGDYLSVASATALNLATGAFTIEAWVYLTASADSYIFTRRASAAARGFILYFDSSTSKFIFLAGDTNVSGWEVQITSTNAFALSQWVHVAVTRNASNVFTLWVNGTSQGTATNAVTIGDDSSNLLIGGIDAGAASYTGYLSNGRIVKGRAVYTSTFTPPTAPLGTTSGGQDPPQGTETSLLTCQSNRFVDNSTNAFAITRNGDVRVTPFSPFAPTAAYSAGTNGGSAYFDGSGDWLLIPNNSALNLAGDFTIECWVYLFGGTGIYSKRANAASYPPIYISVGANERITYSGSTTGSSWNINGGFTSGSVPVPFRAWNHIAVVRSGTTFTAYINGVADSGATFTGISGALFTNTSQAVIGAITVDGNSPANGYISDFRLTNSAVYTSNFTPPTSPITNIANTALLTNFTNAGIIDNTGKNNLETVGNAQIDTTTKKYGTGSLEFDGTGDYLKIPASVDLTMGTGDWTVEFWLNLNATGTQVIFDNRTDAFSANKIYIAYVSNSLNYYTANANPAITGGALSTGTWYHIAISRSATSTKLFINGTQAGSTYSDSQSYNTSNFGIGAVAIDGTFGLNGYIDDLRITKGVARYTSNFSVPTSTFRVR